MTVTESSDKIQKKLGTILVVEDDASLRRLTQVQLDKLGYQTRIAADVSGGLEILRREPVDLVICDLHLPGESGMDLLKKVRAEYPETKFVIVTAYGSINTAIEAMKSGAYDYLTKPLHPVELRALVERVFEQQRLVEEVQVLRSSRRSEVRLQESDRRVHGTLTNVIDSGFARRSNGRRGADYRRNRNRQGIACQSHSLQQRASRSSVRHRELRLDSAGLGGIRAVRPRQGSVHRSRGPQARTSGNGGTAELCFWMKSERCRRKCRSVCFAWSRRARFKKWAPQVRSALTCESLPQPIATWKN